MLRTVYRFVELGLMPEKAIKPEYRVSFNHKNTSKILKKFEPGIGEGFEILDVIIDYKELPKDHALMHEFIGGIS